MRVVWSVETTDIENAGDLQRFVTAAIDAAEFTSVLRDEAEVDLTEPGSIAVSWVTEEVSE